MLDIQKLIIENMKKKSILSQNEYNAMKQVLAEIKTKYVDIREEITSEIQYKMLKKMFDDREKSIEIYSTNHRNDLLQKELDEKESIQNLLAELEKEMPKQMTDEEIKMFILARLEPGVVPNIGIIMKMFKDVKNIDKKKVSMIAKEYCK